MLTTWIRAFDFTQFRSRIVSVNPVQKDNAGVPIFPRLFHQGLIDFVGIQFSNLFIIPGIYQIIIAFLLHRFHKIVCYGDRDIEVIQFLVNLFAVDKLHDVRVVHSQDGHVGPTASASLFDLLGGCVEDLHKRDRPRGHTTRCPHPAFFRP